MNEINVFTSKPLDPIEEMCVGFLNFARENKAILEGVYIVGLYRTYNGTLSTLRQCSGLDEDDLALIAGKVQRDIIENMMEDRDAESNASDEEALDDE